MVTDYTSVKNIIPTFKLQQFEKEYISIAAVINECQLYEVINVSGLIYNNGAEEHDEKNGELLKFNKATIQNETDSRAMVSARYWLI